MWAGGEYSYNLFDNGQVTRCSRVFVTRCTEVSKILAVQDVNFYMAHDKINALACEFISRDSEYDAVLGCQDRFVRVIQVLLCRRFPSQGRVVISYSC